MQNHQTYVFKNLTFGKNPACPPVSIKISATEKQIFFWTSYVGIVPSFPLCVTVLLKIYQQDTLEHCYFWQNVIFWLISIIKKLIKIFAIFCLFLINFSPCDFTDSREKSMTWHSFKEMQINLSHLSLKFISPVRHCQISAFYHNDCFKLIYNILLY